MSGDQTPVLIKVCALATGLTVSEVIKIAAIGPKRYKVFQIPKRSGGKRTICHPSRELKALQYVFLNKILRDLPINKVATAYKVGSSIKENAWPHAKSRVILKIDFENFFPSIKVQDWVSYAHEKFPKWSDVDIKFSSYVMFWGAGGYVPICLSIGAPTSPFLSNILMYEFDKILDKFSIRNNLVYTRYADDITISSNGFLDRELVISEIEKALSSIKYPKININRKKTCLVSKSTSRIVTGLIISNDGIVSLGRDKKRLIRSMVHHAINGLSSPTENNRLAGLLSFANDVEPVFLEKLAEHFGKEKVRELRSNH